MKKVLNFLIENLFLYNIIFNKYYFPMQKVINIDIQVVK